MNYSKLSALLSICVVSGCVAHIAARSESVKASDGVEPWMLDAQAASAAYNGKQYADCVRLYIRSAEKAPGRARADDLYSAGMCTLRGAAGDASTVATARQAAVGYFEKALRTHPSYCDDILDDQELRQELTDVPNWAAMIAEFEPVCSSYDASIHIELRKIYEEDQFDRKTPNAIDWSMVKPRDAVRRHRVAQLEAAAELRTADDYYHAAMIMQHGEDEWSYTEAHRLAARAVAMDPTFVKARWLAAASRDRYLMARSEPQYYGTQFKRIDGRWILWPVDPRATDRERALWCVDPLESAKRHVATMNDMH